MTTTTETNATLGVTDIGAVREAQIGEFVTETLIDDGIARRTEELKINVRRRDSRERVFPRDAGKDHVQVYIIPQRLLKVYAQLILFKAPKGIYSTTQTDEEKKAERLAKLEAWKLKQKLATEKQKEIETAAGARSILDEIDRKAVVSPATLESPLSSNDTPNGGVSPTPYAGKFDPKAIAKKASTASTGMTKLGTDIALPEITKASGPLNSTHTAFKANKSLALAKSSPSTSSSVPLKVRGIVSGFGINTKGPSEPEKSVTKRALDFEDEEGARKKLEKLPTPPLENGNIDEDTMLANQNQEDDDGEDAGMEDAGTEEETAAAARAAAEKREERLQAQNLAHHMEESPLGPVIKISGSEVDAIMLDGSDEIMAAEGADMMVEEEEEEEEEDEADPLDAFMSELGDPRMARTATNSLKIKNKKAREPEAMFGDEEEVDLKTVESNPNEILAMASKHRKKDIPTVNHAKMSYEPFRKNFYNEPSELSEMTEEDVADLRLELDGIKVRGVDSPKPVVKWSQCGLGVQTMDVISRLGYEKPSAIQSQAIPSIMSGRDIIGVAKTGSGKTIAFLLPMFRHIKDQRPLDGLDGPVGLIMTPTRELATQIHKECKPFLKALNLRAVCAYGGAPIKEQIADLKRGAEVIVCTPGRIIELLAANSGRVTNLRRVTYLVLDEADRMFDMGFEPQVMKILTNIRPDRQTVLFSATFPRQMEALAKKTLVKPLEIIVGGRSVVAAEITQIVEVRSEESKFIRLLELLGNLYHDDNNQDDRALIFVDRQESADRLLMDLMRKGYPCGSIHGGKDQIDRDSTIEDFKAGAVPVMIATSVAARGLDVKQLKLVVNYDAPNHLEDYVHRAGRTGRAGNTGTAVTFITEEQERYSLDIAKALRQSGQEVPEDLQKLVDRFIEKVKSGKEKVSGSGFGGKGLERLDQERDAARNRERKTYKTGEEGEDEDKEDSKKDKDDDLVAKAASTVQAASAPAPLVGVPKGIDLDGKITVHKTEVPVGGPSKNPLDKVSRAVANIHERLNNTGVLRQGVPIDNKGPDAGAFHATLEINDFPQKARWAVTNRTNVAKILEATGTSITTKGSFYATGKEPQAGENPKLYILVEGDTEVVVTNAMRELMRLLKEGTIAAADSDARAPASGRYNVV
ncbi:pre-mRNA processing RNA-helicase [Ptychographa xylographoides]|nr:pre-mRNA processing RNA-helicase [Ptychographa xylographoides]